MDSQEYTKQLLVALKKEIDAKIARGEKPTGSLMIYNKILENYKREYGDKHKQN